MSLLMIDGFDYLDDNQITLANKWSAQNAYSSGNSDTFRRFTGFGRYAAFSQTQNWLEKTMPATNASGIFGIAMYVTSSGSNLYQCAPFILYDGTSIQIFVQFNTDRTISIYRGSTSNLLGTTTYTFPTNTWFYLELKWKITNSTATGDVVLYADGVSILSLAAATNTRATANSYATKFRLNGDNTNIMNVSTSNIYYDDFYWCDLGGVTNNAPLGPTRVVTIRPSGNGNSSGFTNSAGNSTNNYTYVNEALVDNDSTYVETGVTGTKDMYTFDALPTTTTTIFGVANNIVAKKTDAGTRTFKHQTRIGSTDYEGSEVTLTTSYQNYQQIQETNPSVGGSWTLSGVNGAQFGHKCHA